MLVPEGMFFVAGCFAIQRLAQVVCYSFVLNCRVNPQKLGSIQKKLEAFCAQDLEIKQWAQKVNKL